MSVQNFGRTQASLWLDRTITTWFSGRIRGYDEFLETEFILKPNKRFGREDPDIEARPLSVDLKSVKSFSGEKLETYGRIHFPNGVWVEILPEAERDELTGAILCWMYIKVFWIFRKARVVVLRPKPRV